MMKVNELRIGNRLLRPNGNVALVNWGVIRDIELGNNSYQPIPLNEEWLLKFGFTNGKYETLKLNAKGFVISFDILNDIFDCYLESVGIDILYVHQLQNLYFVLTGEELNLNK